MPARGIAEFNRLVQAFCRDKPAEEVRLVQMKIGIEALNGVVKKTPVDTGRARGNWQVTIDVIPSASEIKATWPLSKYKGGPGGDGEAVGNEAIAKGTAELQKLGNFATVYIFNNVPYILYLEHGTSTQAPKGMLALTIEELSQMFKGNPSSESSEIAPPNP